MSRIQLIILWVLTLVAGAALFSLKSGETQNLSEKTTLTQGSEVFKKLDKKSVAGLRLNKGEESVTVHRSDNNWAVQQKEDFPADVNKLATAFDKITKLKITQGIVAETQYLDRFGLDPSAEKESDRPRTISILNEAGDVMGDVIIGKARDNTGGLSSGSAGRFVRFTNDDSGVYVVNEDFSFFNSAADSWLKKDFLKIQRPLKVSMTGDDHAKPWSVSRRTQSADFELDGLTSAQETAISKTAPLKSILSSGNFTSLLTEEEAKEKREDAESRKAVISTTEGTVYELSLWPEKSATPPAAEDPASSAAKEDTRNYIVTFKVTQDPQPPTQQPADDASEEAKAEFQAAMINYKGAPARVAKNKLLENRFFLLPNHVVKPLLTKREELFQLKPKPQPAPPTSAVPTPTATPIPQPIGQQPAPKPKSKRIEVVTPPIAIPPLPKGTDTSESSQ